MSIEAQNNPFTSVLMVEAADPEAIGDADPASGQRRLVVGADHLLYLLDDSGVKHLVGSGAVTRASLGLDTSDSPEFAGLNVGHASDTTLARTAAGELAVEGNRIFRVGGADVPVADGGTGASSASAARTNLGLVLGTDVASLTSGRVPISQLASGTPDGTKFIRDDGTLQTPSGGSAGALVLLEQHTASASATLDFTAFISSTYDEYEFHIIGLVAASNSNLYVRVGTGGGPTWDTAANYWTDQRVWRGGGQATNGPANVGQWVVDYSSSDSINASASPVWGRLTFYDPQSTSKFRALIGDISYIDAANFRVRTDFRGSYESTGTALTGVRFLMSTGNITSGTIRVYGVAK